MKNPKCVFCKKRPAVPDEWKDEEEKLHCFSCWTFKQAAKAMETALDSIAEAKNIPFRALISFIPYP